MNISAVLITREKAWPTDVVMNFKFDEVLTCVECPHIFRRFELAAQAKHDTIYVQDDDVSIDIRRLYSIYLAPALPGRLTAVMPLGFQQIYAGTGVTMVGFGCFFPRVMAEQFVEQQQFWRAEFGDAIFEAEADRFFTFSHRPFNHAVVAMRQFARPVKMSSRPGHYAVRAEIFRRLSEMGGRP